MWQWRSFFPVLTLLILPLGSNLRFRGHSQRELTNQLCSSSLAAATTNIFERYVKWSHHYDSWTHFVDFLKTCLWMTLAWCFSHSNNTNVFRVLLLHLPGRNKHGKFVHLHDWFLLLEMEKAFELRALVWFFPSASFGPSTRLSSRPPPFCPLLCSWWRYDGVVITRMPKTDQVSLCWWMDESGKRYDAGPALVDGCVNVCCFKHLLSLESILMLSLRILIHLLFVVWPGDKIYGT